MTTIIVPCSQPHCTLFLGHKKECIQTPMTRVQLLQRMWREANAASITVKSKAAWQKLKNDKKLLSKRYNRRNALYLKNVIQTRTPS